MIRRFISLSALLAVLSACGNMPGQEDSIAVNFAKARLGGLAGANATASAPAAQGPVQGSFLNAKVTSTGAQAALVPAASRGSYKTWISPDGITLTTRSGLLIASRGLGPDLMSTDADDPLAFIRASRTSGQAVRVHRYLDGENQEIIRSYVCRYSIKRGETATILQKSYAVRVVNETCRGVDENFVNIYRIGRGGTIWQSRQWISPDLGYVVLQRIEL